MPKNPLKLFILSCSIFIAGGLVGSTLGVVWIYIADDFALNLSALGVLISAATVGRLVTSFASGPLVNRFGTSWLLGGGLLLSIVSMLIFALAPNWTVCLLAGLLHGFGGGVLASGLNVFAAVHFSARQMNWLHGSFGIGSTFGPLLVTALVLDLGLGWQSTYLVFAGLQTLLAAAFVLTRRDWDISSAQSGGGRSSSAGFRQTLRLPMVWLLFLAFVMATGIELVAGQFANSFLIDARAIDAKTAASWVSLYWGSLTVSRFLVGFIITRLSSGLFMRLNLSAAMLGALLLGADFSPLSSLLGLVLIGFSIAPFAPIMISDIPTHVGSAHIANAVGLVFTGASLGIGMLPWLAGVLAEMQGLEIIPQMLFVAALLTFLLHESILRREANQPRMQRA